MNELALLKPQLSRLKLSGILETLEQRLSQAENEKWGYTLFLKSLFTDEIERRNQKQLIRRLVKSELAGDKTLETFDFSFNPKIHKQTINELASCNFIQQKECIFFLGPSGVGKSHLAQAVGHEACRRGYDVFFRRTGAVLKWLHGGRGDGSYERRLHSIIKIPLLILDDFGLMPYSDVQQADLYQLICDRYEISSTIITSNRDFNEWPAIFSNPLMGSAAMDRLIHKAIKIVIEGKSYRLDNFSKRTKQMTEKK